jgi:hypothetical protein
MATTESSPSAHPSTEDQDHHDQGHPHACLDGYVYLGFTYTGEDGEEYEAFEAIPCRRCAEEAT